jgi:hypothetical protein
MQTMGTSNYYGTMEYTPQMTNAHYPAGYQQPIHGNQPFGGIVSGGTHPSQTSGVLEAFHRNMLQYNYGSTQEYYANPSQQGSQYYSHGYMGQQMHYQDAYGNPVVYPGYHPAGYSGQMYAGHPGIDPSVQAVGDTDRIAAYVQPQMHPGSPGLGSGSHNTAKHHQDSSRS